jgi:hypothetical protein
MLNEFGFRVIRVTNEDVMTNCDGVLVALKIELDAQPERWPNRRTNESPSRTSPSRPNGADDTGARLTTR